MNGRRKVTKGLVYINALANALPFGALPLGMRPVSIYFNLWTLSVQIRVDCTLATMIHHGSQDIYAFEPPSNKVILIKSRINSRVRVLSSLRFEPRPIWLTRIPLP